MGRVFVKNFGDGNYMWPTALESGTITLITDAGAFQFVESDDQDGYRDYITKNVLTAHGKVPDKGTTTGWWNNHAKFQGLTPADIIVHDDGTRLYWTRVKNGETKQRSEVDENRFAKPGAMLVVQERPTIGWSDRDAMGRPLHIKELHPRVREILRTQMTMAKADDDNADYAKALINGEDLSSWHDREDWIERLEKQPYDIVTHAGDWEKQKADMALNALSEVGQSGRKAIHIKKTKDFGFDSQSDLMKYIDWLERRQGGVCQLTGLKYQYTIGPKDRMMTVSLDRIDSSEGYIPGNLQLVCHFANMWKGARDNSRFIELVGSIRDITPKFGNADEPTFI